MKLLALSASDFHQALPMPEAVEAMKSAFADLSAERAQVPQRAVLESGGGSLLVKPAVQPGAGCGAKLLTYYPQNREHGRPLIHALVVLFDAETGVPIGLCEGASLTAWRTGAASGAATDLLAAPDARTAAIFGAGVQARTQLLAIAAVRPLERVDVYSRSSGPLAAFVAQLDEEVDAQVVAASSPEEALVNAQIVCTATPATEPLFDGDSIGAGTHINCVGSFTPAMREVDRKLVARSQLFVDSRQSVGLEAGELIDARDAGITSAEAWTELGEVVEGSRPGRQSAKEVTLFKSVGVAIQDTAAGALALRRARELGLGTELDLS